MESKKPWMSKTLWAAALVALAPLFPPLGVIVAANPAMVSAGIGMLFAGLRFITNGKVSIAD